MIPSPTELRYFMEVANTLNLSRAAERLGVSQPTLTLAMRRLEDSFGQPVLIRGKTGVKLTKSGEKLYDRARFLFEEWEKIRSDIGDDEAQVRGTFTIGCHVSVALYTLPSLLPKLFKEFPHLEIKVSHALSRTITESVISSRVDFGIVVNPVQHPDLVIKSLMQDEVSFWIGNKIKSVDEETILIYDPEMLQSQTLVKQAGNKGHVFQRRLESSSLEVITSLVAAGVGCGVLPGRVAQRDPELNLKKVPGTWPIFNDKICLIYRADAQRSAASRQIIQFMAQNIK